MKNPPFMLIDPLMVEAPSAPLASRRVAVLAGDGLDEAHLGAVREALQAQGAQVQVLSNRPGPLHGVAGDLVSVDHHWLDMPSLMFDAVYVPGGAASVVTLQGDPDALLFLREAYEHGKSIAATGEGVNMLRDLGVALPVQGGDLRASGIVTDAPGRALSRVAELFIGAIIKDRHWRRNEADADALNRPCALACRQDSVGFGPI